MTCSGSAKFTCNVCGAPCQRPAGTLGRESASCEECGSSMRVRALAALLSTEIFGIVMPLAEFPVMKGLCGIGMSDSPELASRLDQKFAYTNTFYHQAPFFDVTQPNENDFGRYDFIVTSEVMEHVPPPVERSFSTLAALLKPEGVLVMTTPYRIGGDTVEHFPDLHEYTLSAPGGQTVLVNRRRDGRVEVFEDLVFHGGHGSTLEMRVFSEPSLRALLAGAGFPEVRVAAESWPEFGIEHAETWSLPIAARKAPPPPRPAELARQYRQAIRRAEVAERELASVTGDYERHIAFHDQSHQEMQRELASRTEWARKIEADLEERSHWALDLQREKTEAIAHFEHARESELQAWECVKALEKELDEARARRVQLETRLWTRLGRRLRTIS